MQVVRAAALSTVLICVSSCSDRNSPTPPEASARKLAVLAHRDDPDGRAFWRARPDSMLWTEVSSGNTDGVAVVGIRTLGADKGVVRGRNLVGEKELSKAEIDVASIPGLQLLERDQRLPILRVGVESIDALRALRKLPRVDYVEPEHISRATGLRFFEDFIDQCKRNGGFADPLLSLPPLNDVYGANLAASLIDIPRAWTRSDGSNVVIGLVDTGIDQTNPQLGHEFGTGMSTGRYIEKHPSGADGDDQCNHGTHMAGVLAAPRDGRGVVGIAYKSNLLSVKVGNNVVLGAGDVTTVRNGIAYAANRARIIVMAFGSLFTFSSIADEISYWHYNYDRFFIGAAGNDPPYCLPQCNPVYFPARMPEVTAVSATSDTCDNCLYGPEVDFEAFSANPTTGMMSNFEPPVASASQSSGATAVVAGIAALVWSRYPTWTRQQVLDRLVTCSRYYLTGRHPERGWGVPNAYCAVGGWTMLWIAGPTCTTRSGNHSFVAQTRGDGPFTYQWDTGETTQQKTTYVVRGASTYTFTESVVVTDQSSGEIRSTYHDVIVKGTADPNKSCQT